MCVSTALLDPRMTSYTVSDTPLLIITTKICVNNIETTLVNTCTAGLRCTVSGTPLVSLKTEICTELDTPL